MCKSIPLTQGQYVIVDDGDYEWLSKFKWHYHNGYAARRDGKKRIFLHNVIMNPPPGKEVDHINRISLDSRRANMRICTHAQNGSNMEILKSNTSGYKGVSWNAKRKKWVAQIKFQGYKMHLGYFDLAEDGARAYDKMARSLFGEYAKTNSE